MNPFFRHAMSVVLPQYRMDPRSNIHGIPHWVRVARNGRLLVAQENGDPAAVQWFSYLHDACRHNDDHDPGHGARAAELAGRLYRLGLLLGVDSPVGCRNLQESLAFHSLRSPKSWDTTVQCCWDADRLDLLRVGIQPDPERMFTETGAKMARALPKLRRYQFRGTPL